MPLRSAPIEGVPLLPDTIVLDACVLLNLFAGGRVEEVLRSLPSRCLVSRYVRHEALWYLAPVNHGTGTRERRDIDLEAVAVAGLLEIVDLAGPEMEIFVELAQELGDGEAASGATAVGRSGVVATDDARARQVFARRIPAIPVMATATLLRAWEARLGLSRTEVAATLEAIRLGARYYPSGDGDDAAWWRERVR